MARLVVCCDGTWNKPEQLDQGVPAPTNVVRIRNAVSVTPDQKVYYHPGVGAGESWWDKAIGGGTGTGLSRNIMSAYEWLSRSYAPGDDIYVFGFSRGAYTVRSLIGFITCCGLLRADRFDAQGTWKAIETLYTRGYREGQDIGTLREEIGQNSFYNAPNQELPIRFVGVWDTVGSLGIPDDMGLLDLLDKREDHTFHSTSLGRNVKTARHALAMDEQRKSFQPTVWTATEKHPDVKQIWFPGVHSDVGGGYREAGLANGALKWMIDEAKATGLVFSDGIVKQIVPDYHDMMHDSCRGIFAMMPTQPRSVPSWLENEKFHESSLRRWEDPPIHQCPYRQPHIAADNQSLEIYARQQWNSTGLWLQAGTSYEFTATGEWVDGTISCGPHGTNDGHFQLGEFAHVAGSLLGKMRDTFRAMTDNPEAQLQFTRRHGEMSWFCLTGAIANGDGEVDGVARPHETFAIGDSCVYEAKRSGYFYAYSNDAWNCYANNKGYVLLKVRKVPGT